MRELHLSHEESTETFLVLVDNDGVRYQLARAELDPQEAAEPEVNAGFAPSGSTLFAVPHADEAEAPVEPETPAEEPEVEVQETPQERTLPEPDPLYAKALTMRPNEIQARIRAGATAAEVADEMGVAESRIEPYAHPVLLERSQVAEAAKQSHPLREDGPAKLTLFEILASAFAARGHSLSDATWDATREPGDAWVVHLRWQAGLTDNEAVWSYKRQMGSAATTEARNAVAADLTDPDFVQPVRSLTAVDTRALRAEEPELAPADAEPSGDDLVAEGDFLRHPDEEEQPQKRRRKAVTPHWEDVLLGVRTTPKRPKK
ncbi:septation protein SepH [Corynebacterium sp. TA-R-1]|uniref:Septation protein SepH n=1 Tax=Corynebacterium stercoris TaxID=2943490 RepID=A0ABT1G2X6_9CORY|nr:septation protein SepH [Corynebacterium stercoris]MCP1388375.1 septation protein SepH [Corynebacterium stercoris]